MPGAVAEINGQQRLGNQFRARRRRLYLEGSEDAPPFAALEAYGVRFDGSISVRKPTRDDIPNQHIFFNGPTTFRYGQAGYGTKTLPTMAFYNDEIEVSNRENVGTKAGEWKLHRGYEGFIAIGPIASATDIIMVMPWNLCRNVTPGRYYSNGGSGGGCPGGCLCPEDTVYPEAVDVTLDIACFAAGPIVTVCNLVSGGVAGACGTVEEVDDPGLVNPEDAVDDAVYSGTYNVTTDFGFYEANYCNPEFIDSLYIGSGYTDCTLTIVISRYVDENYCVKQAISFGFEAAEASSGFVRQAIGAIGTSNNGDCLAGLLLNSCDPLDLSGEGEVDCELDPPECSTTVTPYTICVGSAWTVEITAV